MPRVSTPLRVPGYRPLLSSYTVNQLGDEIALIALSVLIFDRTDSPLLLVAYFLCARVVPALLAPFITPRMDQMPVRRSLPALYLGEAAAFTGMAFLASDFMIVPILVLALIDGTLALVARGISRGAVATVTREHGLLREGNALVNVAFGASSVVGLAAGGVLVGTASAKVALGVNAATFLMIALGLSFVRTLPRGTHEESREGFRQRLRSGWQLARHDRLLGPLLLWQGAAFVFFYLVVPIEVVYVREVLGKGGTVLGVMLACWSGGILVGSVLNVRLTRVNPLLLVIVSTATIAVGYLGIGFSRTVFLACLFSAIGGLGNGFQFVAVLTLAQERTPSDYQARISGLLESIGAATPAFGFIAGGLLTTLVSPTLAYIVAGCGILLLAAVALVAGGPRMLSDLDHDRDDHRAAAEPIVDERGEVVMQDRL